MVNEKRVRLMTRLAALEQSNKTLIEPAKTYYRGDYIGVHLLKNGFRITAAFIIGLILFGFGNTDELMKKLNTMDIVGIGMQILVIYGILLIIYLVLTYLIFSIKFYQSEKKLQTYRNILGRLLVEYEPASDTGEEKKNLGGNRNGSIGRN